MSFTIGSLFDGSGGFPLAGFLCGGVPVWASEIEPYPIAVTKSRFPHVKHLGSVTDIKGDEIEPVDVITFGSPCQDLSVAGKRAGLKHEDNGDDETTRSGLFMEAVRIIKEMREKTNGKYPRFAVWENVPGAFSSNKGEDFKVVLEEFIKIVEPTAVMPDVPKKGWAYADNYRGDGWSIAYRVFDAQYWGVPQRRRRIYLVADFRGERAGEILFERDSLRGYSSQSRTSRETAPGNAESGIGATDCENGCISFEPGAASRLGGYVWENVAGTLRATPGDNLLSVCYGISSFNSNAMLSDNPHSGIYEAATSRTLDLNGGNPACNQGGIAIVEPVVAIDQQGGKGSANYAVDVMPTLCSDSHGTPHGVAYTLKIRSGCEGGGKGALVQNDMSATLATNNDQYLFQPMYCIDGDKLGKAERSGGSGFGVKESDTMYTLTAKDVHGVAYTMQAFGDYKDCGVASGLKARDYKDATDLVVEEIPIALDRAFFNQGQNALYDPQYFEDGTNPTLVARGPNAVCVRYIVRRLTPTECARLQGFPDNWGHPDKNDDFTDEEYTFWLNVRNTHAEINGKQVKDYTKAQMLTWYNKLHTDSAEYKMWGNGIALPNALYVMEGIAASV